MIGCKGVKRETETLFVQAQAYQGGRDKQTPFIVGCLDIRSPLPCYHHCHVLPTRLLSL